jgi:GT2 family glycosyltransferase
LNSKLVSIIVVNYNGGEFVLKCIQSILRSSYPFIEVLIVDNHSTDRSDASIEVNFKGEKRVRIIRNSENTGYSAAINLAAQKANGNYLAILNNDIVPRPDWLSRPVELMEEDHSVGAVQPLLFFYDSPTVVNDAGHFIDKLGIVYSRDSRTSNDILVNAEDEIFGAAGAAIIVRRTVFDDLDGFDSDFFMLFEETDFCWRVWLSGHRVLLVPSSIVYHKARASYRLKLDVSYLFNRNRLCSMLKNYERMDVIRFVPANLLVIMATGLYFLLKSDSGVLMENTKAIIWNLANLRATIQKRNRFHHLRRTPQERLFEIGVIRQTNMPAAMRRLLGLA